MAHEGCAYLTAQQPNEVSVPGDGCRLRHAGHCSPLDRFQDKTAHHTDVRARETDGQQQLPYFETVGCPGTVNGGVVPADDSSKGQPEREYEPGVREDHHDRDN